MLDARAGELPYVPIRGESRNPPHQESIHNLTFQEQSVMWRGADLTTPAPEHHRELVLPIAGSCVLAGVKGSEHRTHCRVGVVAAVQAQSYNPKSKNVERRIA